MTIQRPLTEEDELRLGLVSKHDTPQSPHREHMGGGRAIQRQTRLRDAMYGEMVDSMAQPWGAEDEDEAVDMFMRDRPGLDEDEARQAFRGVIQEVKDYSEDDQKISGPPLDPESAMPPSDEIPRESEMTPGGPQRGGAGHRAYRGERGREQGSTSQDDPSQQTGAEAYGQERTRERPPYTSGGRFR